MGIFNKVVEGVGERVEIAVGPAGVDHRDDERGREVAEAEDQGDVDVAEHLLRHELRREDAEQDVEEVPRQEEPGHGEHEAAEPASQVGELLGLLHVEVGVAVRASDVAHDAPP